jgi:uncharacterized small protein (DUF1192 family)
MGKKSRIMSEKTRGYQSSVYLKSDVVEKLEALRVIGMTPTEIFTYGAERLYIEMIEEGLDERIAMLEAELEQLRGLKRTHGAKKNADNTSGDQP